MVLHQGDWASLKNFATDQFSEDTQTLRSKTTNQESRTTGNTAVCFTSWNTSGAGRDNSLGIANTTFCLTRKMVGMQAH